MGTLRFVLPFAAVTLILLPLRSLFSPLGKSRGEIAAALTAFGLAIVAVLILRYWQGRRSRDAYALLAATAIPLVTGGFALADLLTGGGSLVVSALVVALPAILVASSIERLLYSSEERTHLRALLTGRCSATESHE